MSFNSEKQKAFAGLVRELSAGLPRSTAEKISARVREIAMKVSAADLSYLQHTVEDLVEREREDVFSRIAVHVDD